MSSCFSRICRRGLAALASIASLACTAFESEVSEFPDAGPNGPDSTYAGVGQGIPFGEFGLAPEHFGAPYTGAIVLVSRSQAGSVLRAAQRERLRLVLNLAGGRDHYRNPDGTFNLELWKSRIDAYRDVDFSPYVREGLVLAHYLVDEPDARRSWGGQQISRVQLEEMAAYSKSIWPTLPTAVRATPRWLRAGDTAYQYLDIAWAQWAGPFRGAGAGLTPEQFRDENVAWAKELGLGLVFGMNYLDGGDGSSGVVGTEPNSNWWQMSAAELAHVGTVLVGAPYACALLSWRHDAGFEHRPGVREALDSVAAVAAARGGTSCLRRETQSARAGRPPANVRPIAPPPLPYPRD
jgi:hypothetical protein